MRTMTKSGSALIMMGFVAGIVFYRRVLLGVLTGQALQGTNHSCAGLFPRLFRRSGAHLFLTINLSIRNTDLNQPITVLAVDYHDTERRLIKKFIQEPVKLHALASTWYVVKESDRAPNLLSSEKRKPP
jgi:hypothetical protein